LNDILVRKIGEGGFTYDRVYATTIHELGHAAHWNLLGWTSAGSGLKMLNTDGRVRETWADAVMQMNHMRKFGDFVTNHGECDDFTPDYMHTLGTDFWDSGADNQVCTIDNMITDGVGEIRLYDLYRSLKDARTWNEWRDEIIERHPGQAADITAYFAQF
jgi:hypothetical protein